MNDIDTVYIASGARTPMGSLQGSLSNLSAVDLGAIAIKEAITRAGITGDEVDETIMGCVLSSGLRQAPARQHAIFDTVTSYCLEASVILYSPTAISNSPSSARG